MGRLYVGMDIGSKNCVAVGLNSRGKLVVSQTFKTGRENLISFAKGLKGEAHVLIEECDMAKWVRRTLKPHVEEVTVSEPRRNAWIARGGSKNDRMDAFKLAELNRLGSYSVVWHPDDEEIAAFKVVVQHYEEATRRLSRVKNQIKASFRREGVIASGNHVYGMKGRTSALEQVDSSMVRKVILADYELLDHLIRAKTAARNQLVDASRSFTVVERLKEIPGIGPVLAARFVAYVGDPHRFNREALTSYSCLAVVKRVSDGSPIGREHLSRAGNATLKDLSRTAFVRAHATRENNGIREFYARSLSRTKNATHARLNTQRKILALMLAIWRDGTRYSDDRVTGGAFTAA